MQCEERCDSNTQSVFSSCQSLTDSTQFMYLAQHNVVALHRQPQTPEERPTLDSASKQLGGLSSGNEE